MEVGFNWHGKLKCSKPTGCNIGPDPPLSQHEMLAYSVFARLTDQFEWRGDALTGMDRGALPVERIKIVTETLEYEMSEGLLDTVQAISGWFKRVYKPKPQPQPPEREERVN